MSKRTDIEFYTIMTDGLGVSAPAGVSIRLTLKDKKLDKDPEVRKYLDECAKVMEDWMDSR